MIHTLAMCRWVRCSGRWSPEAEWNKCAPPWRDGARIAGGDSQPDDRGGGIVAVVPGRMGIATFSPLLDARGNSVRGIKTCQELVERFGLHVFESAGQRKEVLV